MNIVKNIREELIEINSLLKEHISINVYSVPENYFSQLSSGILAKINSGAEPFYYFPTSMPFVVPENYFGSLSEIIVGKINKNEVFEELEQLSPLLNKIPKNSVYTVPENFFPNIVRPVNLTQAKIVTLKKTNKIVRFMAAAAIVTLGLIGTFLITEKKSTQSASQVFNVRELKSLSEEEIIRFLKTNSSPENVTSASLNTTSFAKELNKSVKEMSDQEIKEFLQETREPGGI